MYLLKNILGIPKIYLVVQNRTFCTVFGLWSMKSQIAGIFVGIEMTRLIGMTRFLEDPNYLFKVPYWNTLKVQRLSL